MLAYLLTDPKKEQTVVVVNGREGPPFERAGRPALSRNGRVVAYWASRNDGCFVRIGDREEGPFDFVRDPAVSADGSTVAYAAEREGRWNLHIGAASKPVAVEPNHVFLSEDGRHVGWVIHEDIPTGGQRMRVVALEKTGESFSLIGLPVFSPTEPLVAYGAEEEKRKFVVIGERKIETPDRVSDPVFSPDGRKVGYGARIGRELWWKVLNVP